MVAISHTILPSACAAPASLERRGRGSAARERHAIPAEKIGVRFGRAPAIGSQNCTDFSPLQLTVLNGEQATRMQQTLRAQRECTNEIESVVAAVQRNRGVEVSN